MNQRKNHSPEFKAKVALEASHGEMTLAELFKKYDVHPPQIDTWKRVAIESVAAAFTRKGSASESQCTAGNRRQRRMARQSDGRALVEIAEIRICPPERL